MKHACRAMKHSAMTKRRKRRCSGGRSSPKWLENPNMEHIMNPSSLRKTQAICHFAKALNDMKRTSKSWTKLATEA